jgi:hypothetical protein
VRAKWTEQQKAEKSDLRRVKSAKIGKENFSRGDLESSLKSIEWISTTNNHFVLRKFRIQSRLSASRQLKLCVEWIAQKVFKEIFSQNEREEMSGVREAAEKVSKVKKKSVTRPEQKRGYSSRAVNEKATRIIIMSNRRIRESSKSCHLLQRRWGKGITQTIVVMSQREEDVSTIGR